MRVWQWAGRSNHGSPFFFYRVASIEDGCDELPCSLVLVQGVGGRVVGHARLMRVAGRSDAVLVETGIRGWWLQ